MFGMVLANIKHTRIIIDVIPYPTIHAGGSTADQNITLFVLDSWKFNQKIGVIDTLHVDQEHFVCLWHQFLR